MEQKSNIPAAINAPQNQQKEQGNESLSLEQFAQFVAGQLEKFKTEMAQKDKLIAQQRRDLRKARNQIRELKSQLGQSLPAQKQLNKPLDKPQPFLAQPLHLKSPADRIPRMVKLTLSKGITSPYVSVPTAATNSITSNIDIKEKIKELKDFFKNQKYLKVIELAADLLKITSTSEKKILRQQAYAYFHLGNIEKCLKTLNKVICILSKESNNNDKEIPKPINLLLDYVTYRLKKDPKICLDEWAQSGDIKNFKAFLEAGVKPDETTLEKAAEKIRKLLSYHAGKRERQTIYDYCLSGESNKLKGLFLDFDATSSESSSEEELFDDLIDFDFSQGDQSQDYPKTQDMEEERGEGITKYNESNKKLRKSLTHEPGVQESGNIDAGNNNSKQVVYLLYRGNHFDKENYKKEKRADYYKACKAKKKVRTLSLATLESAKINKILLVEQDLSEEEKIKIEDAHKQEVKFFEELKINRKWDDFKKDYVHNYGKLFDKAQGELKSKYKHQNNSNPIVSTTLSLEKALKYTEGSRIKNEIGERLMDPHYRRSNLRPKHPYIGFIDIFSIDKPYFEENAVSIQQEIHEHNLSIKYYYRFDYEVFFVSAIPPEYHTHKFFIKLPPLISKKNEISKENELFLETANNKPKKVGNLNDLFSKDISKKQKVIAKIVEKTKEKYFSFEEKLRKAVHAKNLLWAYPWKNGYISKGLLEENDKKWGYSYSQESQPLLEPKPLSASTLQDIVRELFSPESAEKMKAHGLMHACRVAIWIKLFIGLYKEFGYCCANLSSQDIRFLEIVGLMHDYARENDKGKDYWEEASYSFCVDYLMERHSLSKDQALAYAGGIRQEGVTTETSTIYQKLCHDADTLDSMRVRKDFYLNRLYLYQFLENKNAKKEISELVEIAKKALDIIVLQKDMCKKQCNIRYKENTDPLYTKQNNGWKPTHLNSSKDAGEVFGLILQDVMNKKLLKGYYEKANATMEKSSTSGKRKLNVPGQTFWSDGPSPKKLKIVKTSQETLSKQANK